ncbi:hypothetical protein B0H14DRAFT_2571202 [Mycena olivaceomarginata]|nr:hypothetical protein B0H14DRAFT_2571202 [Mycena olivaceomarginata]
MVGFDAVTIKGLSSFSPTLLLRTRLILLTICPLVIVHFLDEVAISFAYAPGTQEYTASFTWMDDVGDRYGSSVIIYHSDSTLIYGGDISKSRRLAEHLNDIGNLPWLETRLPLFIFFHTTTVHVPSNLAVPSYPDFSLTTPEDVHHNLLMCANAGAVFLDACSQHPAHLGLSVNHTSARHLVLGLGYIYKVPENRLLSEVNTSTNEHTSRRLVTTSW